MDYKHIGGILIGLGWLFYQLYLALITPLHPLLQQPLHLLFGLSLVFLYYPAGKKGWRIIDVGFGLAILFSAYYFISQTERLQIRIPFVDDTTTFDRVVMVTVVVTLLESVRRVLGYNLLIFMLAFIAYAAWGRYFPGWLNFGGIRFTEFTELMVMGPDGIFGIPLATSANILFYFILFGAFLSQTGGGKLLIDMGLKLSNKSSGGPAKAAVISSSMFGMISGSAVANVTTTGVMTIPLMKKVGYKPEQAAAVEAVASTGGQIMPPIMGVGAFIMAEMLGVKYGKIAVSAILPAIAYYLSVFILVDLIARRNRIGQAAAGFEVPAILPRLYLLIPAGVVVYYILAGYSLMTAALKGVALILVFNLLHWKKRLRWSQLLNCVLQGAKQASEIAVPTAACGLIIGVAIQSGIATKFSSIMAGVGGGNLILALLMATAGVLLLGMALPTVAAYLVSTILFVPTLTKLGILPLAAHMFVFYFGIIAQITPPVCLASFTAAGIAGSNSWRTGWTAFYYSTVALLVPFVFVYKPEILLVGSVSQIIFTTFLLFLGTFFLASAIGGFLFVPIASLWHRSILFACAVLIIVPEQVSTAIGLIGGAVLVAFHLVLYRSVSTKKVRITKNSPDRKSSFNGPGSV